MNSRWTASASAPPADGSRAVRALLVVLSVIAGCTDIIGFLGLDGLFTAHVTGNLAVLAAHFADGGKGTFAQLLSVPVFMGIVFLTRLLAGGLEGAGRAPLRPLLLLQALLLAGFFGACAAAGPRTDMHAGRAILAGMLGVSAMAVQNALVQISLKGSPSTAIMTTNATHFALAVGKLVLGGDAAEVARARSEAARTLPVILGFAAGCGIGAAGEAAFALRSLALPAGLALLALALGFAVEPDGERGAASSQPLRPRKAQ